jgi:phenylpyruvate tautomerase PptA (4-oxalocrotonate tautomerase family)
MPVIDIVLVAEQRSTSPAGFAQALADGLGRALGASPGQVWTRLRLLASDCYAENEVVQESADLPVFVTVLRRALPEGPALLAEIAAVTRTVAEVTGRSAAQVHVEYAPAGRGRLAFGGQLVE